MWRWCTAASSRTLSLASLSTLSHTHSLSLATFSPLSLHSVSHTLSLHTLLPTHTPQVCESQTQFSASQPSEDVPIFSGARGGEISKSLSRIQTSFQKLMNNISQLKYDILDVSFNPNPFA